MARDVETVTIGDRSFEVRQLPAMQGMAVLNELLRICGTPLAHLITGFGPNILAAIQSASDPKKALAALLSSEVDGGAAGIALTALFAQLTPERQEKVIISLLRPCRVVADNGPQDLSREMIDTLFAGRLDELMRLVREAARVNFGSFWPALRASGLLRRRNSPSASETSSTSATQRNG